MNALKKGPSTFADALKKALGKAGKPLPGGRPKQIKKDPVNGKIAPKIRYRRSNAFSVGLSILIFLNPINFASVYGSVQSSHKSPAPSSSGSLSGSSALVYMSSFFLRNNPVTIFQTPLNFKVYLKTQGCQVLLQNTIIQFIFTWQIFPPL